MPVANPTCRFFGLVFLLLLPACGGSLPDPESIDTHADAADAIYATMAQYVEVLEGIESVEDAQAAVSQLKEIASTFEAIGQQIDGLPALSADDARAQMEKYKDKMDALGERGRVASERLGDDPAIMSVLADVLREVRFSTMSLDAETEAQRDWQEEARSNAERSMQDAQERMDARQQEREAELQRQQEARDRLRNRR